MLRKNFLSVLLSVFLLTSMIGIVPCAAVESATDTGSGTTYYVDATSGSDNNSGTSEDAAWKTLVKINSTLFEPGDSILLKRGSVFPGGLAPQGSGTPGNPITLGAYDSGKLPVVDAGSGSPYAIQLFNQEYWNIDSLEVIGGTQWGIRVSGDQPNRKYTGYNITNCVVHGVYSPSGKYIYRNSGLINFYLWDQAPESQWEDIVIADCTVYDTTQFNGIGVWGSIRTDTRSENVTVRNCTAYDIGGVGIHVTCSSNVIIEGCLVHDAAKEAGTGIEIWRNNGVLMQYNESYNIGAKGVPGVNDYGAFDIDYYNNDVLMQYNYGHDSAGYGVTIISAIDDDKYSDDDKISSNIVVRYNVFSNNARNVINSYQGTVRIFGWDGGVFDGLQFYNNTLYHNPANAAGIVPSYAINDIGVGYTGDNPNFIKNNIIYSTVPTVMQSNNNVCVSDNNLYYVTNGITPKFKRNNTTYTNIRTLRNDTGFELNSKVCDPLLVEPSYHSPGMPSDQFAVKEGSRAIDGGADFGDMGDRDFSGNPIPEGITYDIGACESGFTGDSVNIALDKLSYASSTQKNNIPAAGNDGDDISIWCASNNAMPQWYMVDLGEGYQISGTRINFEAETVYRYKIEVSEDKQTWSTVADKTGNTDRQQVWYDDINAVGRYIRVTITDCGGWWACIRDFSAFGTPVNTANNLALNKPVTASSQNANNAPEKAVDGDAVSKWAASSSKMPQWLQVDLEQDSEIGCCQVMFESESAYQYKIETSLDGENWTTAVNRTTNTSSQQEYTDYFSASARYVRLTVTGSSGGWWAAVREFSIYEPITES